MLENKSNAEKLATGKTTISGLFKSKEGKAAKAQNILEKIGQQEKDIVNYQTYRDWLVIYIVEVAIPRFRQNKSKGYLNAMTNFCLEEISNSNRMQDSWSDFMETIKKAQRNM